MWLERPAWLLGKEGLGWEDDGRLERGVRHEMMGRSHALSGWCAGLVVAPLIGVQLELAERAA